jgi:hypothetical protein
MGGSNDIHGILVAPSSEGGRYATSFFVVHAQRDLVQAETTSFGRLRLQLLARRFRDGSGNAAGLEPVGQGDKRPDSAMPAPTGSAQV